MRGGLWIVACGVECAQTKSCKLLKLTTLIADARRFSKRLLLRARCFSKRLLEGKNFEKSKNYYTSQSKGLGKVRFM